MTRRANANLYYHKFLRILKKADKGLLIRLSIELKVYFSSLYKGKNFFLKEGSCFFRLHTESFVPDLDGNVIAGTSLHTECGGNGHFIVKLIFFNEMLKGHYHVICAVQVAGSSDAHRKTNHFFVPFV
jgi:hypothetical protein